MSLSFLRRCAMLVVLEYLALSYSRPHGISLCPGHDGEQDGGVSLPLKPWFLYAQPASQERGLLQREHVKQIVFQNTAQWQTDFCFVNLVPDQTSVKGVPLHSPFRSSQAYRVGL